MKSATKINEAFQTVASQWLRELAIYSDEQFSRKPAPDEWSIGQVYEHLTAGAFRFHFRHIDNCSKGKGEGGSKTFPGKLVMLLGSFPKRRIKVPASPEYTPKQPASVASARENLEKLMDEMKLLRPKIESASQSSKSRHPMLGAMNAREWYQMIEMHFRHHLQQKERLDKFLEVNQ
jgi:hypothetical protein